MKFLCSDSLLIVFLGLIIAFVGIVSGCHIIIHRSQGSKIPYIMLLVLEYAGFLYILYWVVHVSCKELEVMEEKYQAVIKEDVAKKKRKRELEALHVTNLQSKWNEDDLDILGVSVYHLQHTLMKSVRAAGLNENSKIYEIEDLSKLDKNGIVRQKGADAICPIDGKKGAAYVHSIVFDENDNENPDDHFGKAQVMLSYTWGYTFGDVMHTLLAYCTLNNLDPRCVYVWICFLCVNQHRVIEKKRRGESVPFVDFRNIFEKRVRSINHLLPMMSPWDDPEYLKRVWCLFEWIIARRYKCKTSIIMPHRERANFLKMFDDVNMSAEETITRLFDGFSNTKVQDAKASEESDRENIMQIIESSPGGYDEFNVEVNQVVREWMIGIMKDEVVLRRESVNHDDPASRYGFARFLTAVGCVLDRIGEKRDALAMDQESLTIIESIHGRQHQSTATTMNNIALVLRTLDKKEEALAMHREVLSIREALFGKKHSHTADTMNNIAVVLDNLGEKEEALAMHREVLSIREALFGKKHSDTAATMNNMACVLDDLDKKEEALVMYREVLSIREALFGKKHSDTADAMYNIARILYALDEKKEALQMLRECLEIYKSVLGPDHPQTANARAGVAFVSKEVEQ